MAMSQARERALTFANAREWTGFISRGLSRAY